MKHAILMRRCHQLQSFLEYGTESDLCIVFSFMIITSDERNLRPTRTLRDMLTFHKLRTVPMQVVYTTKQGQVCGFVTQYCVNSAITLPLTIVNGNINWYKTGIKSYLNYTYLLQILYLVVLLTQLCSLQWLMLTSNNLKLSHTICLYFLYFVLPTF